MEVFFERLTVLERLENQVRKWTGEWTARNMVMFIHSTEPELATGLFDF